MQVGFLFTFTSQSDVPYFISTTLTLTDIREERFVIIGGQ